ncbi:MAG: ribose-5-phosphate isomerase A [Candidatus ainarchaeum sp.]|nr:ribose-5-phosphate isomerase A [Candidatus ainarchaeum sp.]
MLLDEHIDGILQKYVKDNSIISFGTDKLTENFIKKLAVYLEHSNLNIKIVPTSLKISELCVHLKIPTCSLNDNDVDLAFDFADQVDQDFNYISNDSTSLVRDKMIAQESAELIVICEEENFVERLNYNLLLEITPFATKKTLLNAMNLGEAKIKMKNDQPVLSETGNNFIEVKVDEVYDLDDLDYQAKNIPGVLETSLFLGYADRVLIHGQTVTMKSRIDTTISEE